MTTIHATHFTDKQYQASRDLLRISCLDIDPSLAWLIQNRLTNALLVGAIHKNEESQIQYIDRQLTSLTEEITTYLKKIPAGDPTLQRAREILAANSPYAQPLLDALPASA